MTTEDEEDDNAVAIFHACRITVAYLTVYALAIVLQVYTQKKLWFRARKTKAQSAATKKREEQEAAATTTTTTTTTTDANDAFIKFDRYQSPQMLHADRAVGNLLEWMPCFLGLLWILVILNKFHISSKAYVAAWSYVGFRALYVLIIHWQGVPIDGWHSSLLAATYPAYICLIILYVEVLQILLLVFD